MSNAVQTFQTADELPADLAQAILHWTLAVADTKHRIGLQFSHWVTGTPALEAAVGSAAICQDELGHARSFYALLKNHPGAPEAVGAENDLEARDVYYAPSALMPRWESWLQVIAVNVVLDSALALAIGQTHASAYQPFAGRTAKILQEEKFHRIFGQSWIERLGGQGDENLVRLQRHIDWAWRITSEWIGPDDDPVTGQLVAAGVLQGDTATLRQQWQDEVIPVLTACGLNVPSHMPDWSSWDSQFRQCNLAASGYE